MTKHLDIDTKAMRAKILDLAIRGKLTDQRQEDGNARDLLKAIQAEKERLIKEKKIKKEKPLPDIAEDEKPFDIPDNWEWVRLRDISSKIVDGTHHSPPNQTTGAYMYVTAKNIKSDGVHLDNITYVSENIHKEIYSRCNPEMGDILYIKDGATTGIVTINNIKQEYSLLSSVALIKTFDAIYNPYIVYALRNPVFYGSVRDKMTGTGITRITLRVLSTLLIPLPPLAEQRRIADKVSALFAQLDVIDKTYEEYRELQQAMKAKLLELAMQGKLTDQRKEDGDARNLFQDIKEEKQRLIAEKKIKKEKPLPEIEADEVPFEIPKNWMWVRMGNLGAPIQYPFADGPFGSNLKKEHYTTNREVRIIQLSNIGENGWRDENVKYTTFEHLKLISRSEVRPGDIVIAKMMPAGRAIIVPDKDPKYVLSSDAVKFVPNKHLYLPFVINCINSPVFQNQVTANVQGTTRKRTSLSKLKNCLLPIPPLAEQKRIVAKLDELLPLL